MPPILQRVYAGRGIDDPGRVEYRLGSLLRPDGMGGLETATDLLDEAIRADRSILVVGDYDCDGATGCAVAVRGLRLLGARRVDFAIPDRQAHGYGLSPALVASLPTVPELILTVDNGINAHAGIAAARARGAQVIVTDHHLPGAELPLAAAIVNPNVPGDAFPSKALAGVGVMFYLLLALRACRDSSADLRCLLDLVALGTVADVVPLDDNNRILVSAGLRRIRGGAGCVGIRALAEAAGCDPATLASSDFAFALAPRVNAAGRLADMRTGVRCLLAETAAEARALATELSAINDERRQLQAAMTAEAEESLARLPAAHDTAAVVWDRAWHPGVVGLVASRLRERLHRPAVALAPAGSDAGLWRGSARSIPGVHVRDVLVDVARAGPKLLRGFGGHAMAAGLEIAEENLPAFAAAFAVAVEARLDDSARTAILWSDGELAPAEMDLATAEALRDGGPWGQGFPVPLFDNVFVCTGQQAMGATGRHRRLRLRDPRSDQVHAAVQFNVEGELPLEVPLQVAYELVVNDWAGARSARLLVRQAAPLA